MKILVVISALSRGGAERVVSTLTREWSRRHQVVIALFDTTRTAYDYGGTIIDLRLPAVGSPLKKAYRVAWARSIHLARLFRRERPDRIVSFMESANFPAIVAAAVTGFLGRLSVSVRTNPSMVPIAWRWLIPLLYRLPARVVAPSEGVKQGLDEMGVPRAKVLVIPNPVANEAVASKGARSPFLNRFILGVGRLHREKGFDRLLTAFSNVERSDLHLLILGEGDERADLISLSRDLGIKSRVHFPGAVTDVGTWYQHAQCFVLSSRHEGWPNALMEAMANGCPSVSFDCRYGPAEICEGGKSGVLVAQDDVEALTAAITQVVSDSTLRSRLAAAGRKRAAAFIVEKIASFWLADARV